ncbi:MAG: hypothetical protein RLZZ293_467 [Pseudomonadota bacterium]|jgi:alpha-ketoglutarate-dependent taurine dioxygenase
MELVNFAIEEQKQHDGKPFPFVIDGSDFGTDKEQFFAWVKTNKADLLSALHEYDAILFRNFPIEDAFDFERMLDEAEFPMRDYVGGAAPRNQVTGGRILTANESPASETIPFHHEMSQVPNPPQYIFFSCGIAAHTGGATPIVQSHRVYSKLLEQCNEFLQMIEQQGVRYIRVMPEQTDTGSAIGRSWKETFQCQTEQEAEQKMRELGMDWEWLDNGNLKTITAVLPAIRTDQLSQRKTFFNSIIAVYTGWNDSRNIGKQSVITADGKYMDEQYIEKVNQIMHNESVAFKWQEGDVLWVNNSTVLHARQPFAGDRKIYASIS